MDEEAAHAGYGEAGGETDGEEEEAILGGGRDAHVGRCYICVVVKMFVMVLLEAMDGA